MNQIVLMGRLTRDPELRQTTGGIPVASFTLAVDRPYTSKGEGEKQTDFIDVVAWRNTAEFVSKHFVKGQLAAVTGRLQIREWTDKDNNKRRSAEVVADNVYFTGDRRGRDGDTADSYAPRQSGSYRSGTGNTNSSEPLGGNAKISSGSFATYEDDEELPF